MFWNANRNMLDCLLTAAIFTLVLFNVYENFMHTWFFPVYYDEVLTLRTIFFNPIKIIGSLFRQGPKGYSGDFFPPFYYLLVHWLFQAGAYEFGVRLANNIIVLLAFCFVYKKMTAIDEKVAALFFIMAVSTSIYYAGLFYQIRPYVLYFSLQICSIVSVCVGVLRQDVKSIALAGFVNVLSLYTHYASIGNVVAEIGFFFCLYLTDKKERRFNRRALLILSVAAAMFLPWLPGYFTAAKMVAATFGASSLDLEKILRLAELVPLMIFRNDTLMVLFALLGLAGIAWTDKRIVAVILAWGLTPAALIAVSGHPVSVRHMMTLGSAVILLSGFGLARLTTSLDSKIVMSAASRVNTGLVMILCLGGVIGILINKDKIRHYAADVSPYAYHALTLALDHPGANALFTKDNDTFANTIFRWYLGDVIDTTSTSWSGEEKNVLILERGVQECSDGTPELKRLVGSCGMDGFRVSGTTLKNNSPLRMDPARPLTTFVYDFTNYAVLEDAFSWNNILIDTKHGTLEPLVRLEDAAIVFRLRLPRQTRTTVSFGLLGNGETGSQDIIELQVSPDNVGYAPAAGVVVKTGQDGRFSLACDIAWEGGAEDCYVRLLLRPAMTAPSTVLQALTISLAQEQPPSGAPVAGDQPAPPAASLDVSSMAERQPGPRHLLQSPTETVQVIAPVFDADFDLARDLFTSTNVRIKRNEGCLTCDSEGPCRLTYFLNSPTRLQRVKIIFYPRIFNDKLQNNYVRLAYSYDGQNYHQLWSTENDGSLAWFGQREELYIPLQGDVRNLFLAFELHGEGSQLQSLDTHAMYIVTESHTDGKQPARDGQAARLGAVKRLLGL